MEQLFGNSQYQTEIIPLLAAHFIASSKLDTRIVADWTPKYMDDGNGNRDHNENTEQCGQPQHFEHS